MDKAARAAMNQHRPAVVWFTGLSGAGKSTIADIVESKLHALGARTYLLDGDNVRHGLNRDLGFTDADRVENIRRVAEVAGLMVDAGLIVLVSFISPFRAERRLARDRVDEGEFIEIHVDTPLDVAETRDPKGLYAKHAPANWPTSPASTPPTSPPNTPKSTSTPPPRAPKTPPTSSSGRCGPATSCCSPLRVPHFERATCSG